jgi:hypothetical protein
VRPAPVAPPPPVAPERRQRLDVALRLGVTTAFESFWSAGLAGEVAVPLIRERPMLDLALGLGVARGEAEARTSASTVVQAYLTVGARLAVALAPGLRVEAGAGLGWAVAWADVDKTDDSQGKPPDVTDGGPVLYAGAALAWRLGRGELVGDLRWLDLRLSNDTLIQGGALGLAPSVGYRLTLF